MRALIEGTWEAEKAPAGTTADQGAVVPTRAERSRPATNRMGKR
jgi:hypothetical protein